ncbi:MAG: hypothetical protein ABIY70_05125 [Capsulimonas sp.]|uniref:hypothetical protein n=1 Tax=Capsulimonas sp. TaxID=2494211 RepID=UPI00326447AF
MFHYTGAGEILPTTDENLSSRASKSIEVLSLDNLSLNSQREEAINGILEGIDENSQEDIKRILQNIFEIDSRGRYTPFATTIAYILEKYYLDAELSS